MYKVFKFGGASIKDVESIKNVGDILLSYDAEKLVVVFSAMGKVTNMLEKVVESYVTKSNDSIEKLQDVKDFHNNILSQLFDEKHAIYDEVNNLFVEIEWILEDDPNQEYAYDYDQIVSIGEFLSTKIMSAYLCQIGYANKWFDARDLIRTDNAYRNAKVDWKTTVSFINNQIKEKHTVTQGFIGCTSENFTSTLGREGSDFSAAILAHVLNADVLEIWTDVSGMYTANPKLVKQATPIEKLSYLEAMELSHFGAKVIFPPTLQPLVEKQIPVRIKNTFAPEDNGTLIDNRTSEQNGVVVKGISHIDQISLISLEGSGMVGIPGFSKRLFEALSIAHINVIMITQASSEHSICIAVRNHNDAEAKLVIDTEFAFEISLNKVAPAKVENDLVNIAIVGDNMKNHQGISGKMFSSLGANNVNIRAIAQGASERNISIMINKKDTQKALNTLHETFFENDIKELNLFIVGVGNVGSKLLSQIQQQQQYLKDNLLLRIRVIAISNSRTMVLGEDALDLNQWSTALENGKPTDINAFFEHAKGLNLRNSIFVDNTANAGIAYEYERYLNNNIGVVTCNKIACADSLENYMSLKRSSRKYGSPFLFETNVGAGLPIIDTLNNLIASGDQVVKIQAVLSGSLNFVFNNFKEGTLFKDVVVQAQKEGYTEPDPKIDLSGIDVARKILILARESGLKIELKDIENVPFLPKACLDTPDNETFFDSLIDHKDYFEKLLDDARSKNARLKYVAQLENGVAKVGLQEIPEGHDFYNLEGSDNIILFYTNRYTEQPLIVKGAGAGAEVTASGIFADIIRIGKR